MKNMTVKGNPLKELIKLLDKLEKDKLIYALSVQQSGINDHIECKYISFKIIDNF